MLFLSQMSSSNKDILSHPPSLRLCLCCSMFPRLHGDSRSGGVRLRYPLRVWYLQPEDQQRLAGTHTHTHTHTHTPGVLEVCDWLMCMLLHPFRWRRRMIGWGTGTPGRRRDRSTCCRFSSTAEWRKQRAEWSGSTRRWETRSEPSEPSAASIQSQVFQSTFTLMNSGGVGDALWHSSPWLP